MAAVVLLAFEKAVKLIAFVSSPRETKNNFSVPLQSADMPPTRIWENCFHLNIETCSAICQWQALMLILARHTNHTSGVGLALLIVRHILVKLFRNIGRKVGWKPSILLSVNCLQDSWLFTRNTCYFNKLPAEQTVMKPIWLETTKALIVSLSDQVLLARVITKQLFIRRDGWCDRHTINSIFPKKSVCFRPRWR